MHLVSLVSISELVISEYFYFLPARSAACEHGRLLCLTSSVAYPKHQTSWVQRRYISIGMQALTDVHR